MQTFMMHKPLKESEYIMGVDLARKADVNAYNRLFYTEFRQKLNHDSALLNNFMLHLAVQEVSRKLDRYGYLFYDFTDFDVEVKKKDKFIVTIN